ncbi:MAG: heavy-metal-associated domain-containing protein [Ruminococcus sp.]|nr:heavy-metal-associated domain-containing protein [Ruminococcus sp.]
MTRTTVKIEGMMCQNCERHMTEAFKKAFKVREVTASHEDKQAVIVSDTAPDSEKLRETVEAAGYKFISAESEEIEKKGFPFFRKK